LSSVRIAVTGADGFIGKNLCLRLREQGHGDGILPVKRGTNAQTLREYVATADFVFHLAGVNRPADEGDFVKDNVDFTATLCAALKDSGRHVPVAYTSSIQASLDTPYGRSKRGAETVLRRHAADAGAVLYLMRLPNVFGKWARPEYNSVVATFCHRIARDLPITIHDAGAAVKLVHIDDVVERLIGLLGTPSVSGDFMEVEPVYETTVGDLASILRSFADSRKSLVIPAVGTGFLRALYATYVSYLPPESFAYDVPRHGDSRGVFIEMLKTGGSGQFSYFTAKPGVTRGEHYHHSKTEKFLVITGTAVFRFRNVDTGETHEVVAVGGDGRIVETIPGWTHDVTNVGDGELAVMLWANEIFDRSRPDTVRMKVAI
jgi:UDP-2-acetamido-2,6-beta-L-arabino-hexul-4-ose reductase